MKTFSSFDCETTSYLSRNRNTWPVNCSFVSISQKKNFDHVLLDIVQLVLVIMLTMTDIYSQNYLNRGPKKHKYGRDT